MDDVLRGEGRRGSRAGGFGPSVVVLAMLSVTWMLSRHGRDAAPELPQEEVTSRIERPADVDVWVATARIDEKRVLRVRLAPLHADPARQAFDAAALAKRFGATAGEPWRLELSYEAPPRAGALDLSALGLVDDVGSTWIRPGSDGAGAIVDPLRALFAAPPALEPGGSARIVLLGPRPAGAVRVGGLSGDGIDLALATAAGESLGGPWTRVAARGDGGAK